MVETAVVGARGYLGRELVRLLHSHPDVSSVTPISRTGSDDYGQHVPSMRHANLRLATPEAAASADVIFTSTPGGGTQPFVEMAAETGATLIDLSRDNRLKALANEDGWHYGLADLQPPQKGAKRIANPGCYPTASLLATLPFTRAESTMTGPIIVDGKSGTSGGGFVPSAGLHFPAMSGSTRAYKVDGHDHQPEIAAAIGAQGGPAKLRFTPHLVPQSRGLLATVYIPCDASRHTAAQVQSRYETAFEGSPFVSVVPEADTATVAMSNMADVAVHLDAANDLLVARCAIDNLLKGGAGQAVQNMNHCLGLAPTAGLGQTGGGI